MPRMRLLEFCGAAVLGFTFGISAAPAQEATNDKKFELKLSHWVPPTHPLQKAIEEWGADVEKASGGTITSTVFPSQQSARRSTITTWRATALPISLMSILAISRAGSRSSLRANCLFWSETPRAASARSTVVPQVRSGRDERREILLRFSWIPDVPFKTKKIVVRRTSGA